MLDLCAAGAWSEPVPAVTNLSLDAAVAEVLRENPDLRSLRARWEAMREAPFYVSALPQPVFRFGAMDSVRDGTWPDTAEKRFMLEQEFPWFGKRRTRAEIARGAADAMFQDLEALRRETVRATREAFHELFAARTALEIVRGEEQVLTRMLRVAETRYAAGGSGHQDVAKAQSEVTMLRVRLLDLGAREATLATRLNALLGRPPDSPLPLAPGPSVAWAPGELEPWMHCAETNRPELLSALALCGQAERQEALARKEYYPDLALGLEYRLASETDDMAMLTVGVPLPVWRRATAASVREAGRMAESRRAAAEAARLRALGEVRDAWVRAGATQRAVQLYESQLVPEAELRFASSEAGYRSGKVDFLDLLESERFLLDARLMHTMAKADAGAARAQLEWASGALPDVRGGFPLPADGGTAR